jgi:hypothetical protein
MRKTGFCRTPNLVVLFVTILGPALSASADDHFVPISGQVNETFLSTTSAPDGLHLTAAGEGNASHLGRLTSAEHAIIHPDGSVQAQVVLTAANGDQLFWRSEAMFTSPTTAAGTITFTGGTGRFRHASGTAHLNAVIAPDGAHVSITFEGTVRYWHNWVLCAMTPTWKSC